MTGEPAAGKRRSLEALEELQGESAPSAALKQRVKRWRYSGDRVKRWTFYIANALWHSWRFATAPRLRAQRITAWKFSDHVWQRSTATGPDRYPILFEQCRKRLANVAEPRILSFGCSTGEEVFSLGRYLPHAIIVGVDVNAWCIRECNRRKTSAKHVFYDRFAPEFARLGNFDAVFCMAVLQRTENRMSLDNSSSIGVTFERFERELGLIDARLKVGGLLFIDHTDFDFLDTIHAPRYEALHFERDRIVRSRPVFDRNNKKVSESAFLYRVFVKRR